jgi:AraC-like DNA-binding protein
MSITPLVFISFILIIQSIYRIFLSNYNRIIVPLLLLFVLIIILSHESDYYYQIGFILRLISVIICIPFFIFLIYKLNRIYPDKFLLRMIITMAIISTIIIVIETYLGTTGGRFTDILGIFSPVFYITILAVLISREIMKRRLELEFSYDILKRYEGHEKELSITDSSEEKLKRVIDFINENYTSDLSREGLAAAVEINPNYMGSLFKTYTGKTINEYINHLRIENAIKQLKEKKRKITDIAFSVGFESLVTFNRVFKKTRGKTPTEYRDEEM